MRYILKPSDTTVDTPVIQHDGSDKGIVTEVTETTVTVDWGVEKTKGVPGSRYSRILESALRTGMLLTDEPGPAITEDGEIRRDSGDVGGDVQTSPSCSRRWIVTNGDGTYQKVTLYAYMAVEDPDTTINARTDPWVQVLADVQTVTKINAPDEQEIRAGMVVWDGYHEPGATPESVCRTFDLDDVLAAMDATEC